MKDVADVVLHRLDGELQAPADALVLGPSRHQLEDVHLPWGELSQGVAWAIGKGFEIALAQIAVEIEPAATLSRTAAREGV